MILAENIQTIEVAGKVYPRRAKLVLMRMPHTPVEQWSIDDSIACLSGFAGYQNFMRTGFGCCPHATYQIAPWAVEAADEVQHGMR